MKEAIETEEIKLIASKLEILLRIFVSFVYKQLVATSTKGSLRVIQ